MAASKGVGVDGDHRLDPMASDRGKVGVVYPRSAQVSDVGVAELVRRGVQAREELAGVQTSR